MRALQKKSYPIFSHFSAFFCIQPFSQRSRTPTVAKECQIGLYDTSEADLALFWNSWSAGYLRERL